MTWLTSLSATVLVISGLAFALVVVIGGRLAVRSLIPAAERGTALILSNQRPLCWQQPPPSILMSSQTHDRQAAVPRQTEVTRPAPSQVKSPMAAALQESGASR
jgi:hypothetical protein